MKITVNDVGHSLDQPLTVGELLKSLGLERKGVAVELNLNLVPASSFDLVTVGDGDQLEVVTLAGGG